MHRTNQHWCPIDIVHALAYSSSSLLAGVYLADICSSTNDYLLSRKPPPQGKFNLCIARNQNAGRGRHGKIWHSNHQGIYLSVAWQTMSQAINDGWLLVTTALHLAKSLQALGVSDIKIKWPNDLYYNNAKLGGMLIESRADIAVMGIGLNIVTPSDAMNDSKMNWIGLDSTGIVVPTYTELLIMVIDAAVQVRQPISVKENRELFLNFDLLYNRSIKIDRKGKKVSVIAKGIDHKARLLAEYKGQIEAYSYIETNIHNDEITDRHRQ